MYKLFKIMWWTIFLRINLYTTKILRKIKLKLFNYCMYLWLNVWNVCTGHYKYKVCWNVCTGHYKFKVSILDTTIWDLLKYLRTHDDRIIVCLKYYRQSDDLDCWTIRNNAALTHTLNYVHVFHPISVFGKC